MTQWVLDDGPFGDLAVQFDAAWAWSASSAWMVREVAKGADRDKSGRRGKLLAMTSGGSPVIVVADMVAGSKASQMLFGHLRTKSTDAASDLGEHASIAFCAIDAPKAVFVTSDKGAAFLAVAELGSGRVASPFEFWEHLHGSKFITTAQLTALSERTVRTSNLPGRPLRFQGTP